MTKSRIRKRKTLLKYKSSKKSNRQTKREVSAFVFMSGTPSLIGPPTKGLAEASKHIPSYP